MANAPSGSGPRVKGYRSWRTILRREDVRTQKKSSQTTFMARVNLQSASGAQSIPLDFRLHSTDTSTTAFVATLVREFSHRRNHVHQGRVQSILQPILRPIQSARIELHRTAVSPLTPFRHHVVLGRPKQT